MPEQDQFSHDAILAGPRAQPAVILAQLGYFPHGPDGGGSWGIFVDTLPKALLVAVVCLLLFLFFTYVLVLTARAHARIASALLRAPADPLADAKEVLSRPGPLGPLHPAR